MEMLREREIGSSGMLLSNERRSTVKTRIIGNNHQLLRIDDEETNDLSEHTRNLFIAHCLETIKRENPDVIIFEDYDKGVISKPLIDAVTSAASAKNIPVTVDPKFRNFGNYTGVSLFKPNFGELLAGTGTKIDKRDTAALQQIANKFMQGRNIALMMVTLSDAGVFITDGTQGEVIAAHVRDISDVSGAGDTVISVASLSLACGLSPQEVAMLANLAGGLVCEEIGVVPVNAIRFAEEAIKLILQDKEKLLSFGAYPEVTLAEARKRRDEAGDRRVTFGGVVTAPLGIDPKRRHDPHAGELPGQVQERFPGHGRFHVHAGGDKSRPAVGTTA